MWFSPWRRVLRGRSGDAKPSGLRAGTKFVEEDTGIEYTYDPVMKDWKKKVAPYSALVAKDGSTVWAEDASGKTIASGESGVDDASVIQSALDVRGKIYLVGTQDVYEYRIQGQLLFPSYTFLVGIGRRPKLFMEPTGDLTRIRPKIATGSEMIGLINLEIDGNGANQERADQRIITPSNVSYFYVRDCYIHDAAAAWIATTPLDGETYIPQKYWFIQNNIFDKIYTSGITSLNGHDISNAYIENNICLNPADVVINFAGSESKNLHIRGNKIYGGIGGIFLEQGAGDNSTITDNIIIQSGQNIYVSGKNAIIKGNYCYGGSYGIRSIGEKNIISNNILVNQDSSGRSISASDFDTVSNNKIDNSDTGAIGISIPRDKTACIKHNEIRGCSVGINTNSNPNCECVGNRFELCDRGIHLYCGSAGTLYTKNWLIESNYFVSCGVGISSWIDGGDNFGHRISNNMFVMTKKQPILLKRVHDCSIINNEIIDASAESANEYAAVELAQVCDSIKIIGNIIVSPNGYHKYCIALATISSSVTNCIIRRNYLRDWQTAPILLGGTGHIIKENDGYATENSGTATFSGDGVAKVFEIGAHGLVTTDPSKIAIKVTPASSDAIAASPCVGYVDPVDNTKIKVKFSSAPASGADNVKIVWYARVIS